MVAPERRFVGPAVAAGKERKMRRSTLFAAILAASALGVNASAQQGQLKGPAEEGTDSESEEVQQQQGSGQEEGTKVTGTVTAADPQTHEITIEGETYVMPEEGGGASLFPQTGAQALLRG
jgi:hypothetical protein